MRPPVPVLLDVPVLGGLTIAEQFSGPGGLRMLAAAGRTGDSFLGWCCGRRDPAEEWLFAFVPGGRLIDVLAGEIDVRDAFLETPSHQVLRVITSRFRGGGTGETLPSSAVVELLPPPGFRVDRRWMKGPCPWFANPAPAAEVPPEKGAPDRKPLASSIRPRRLGSWRRLKVWLPRTVARA